jgi:hypothetical protein
LVALLVLLLGGGAAVGAVLLLQEDDERDSETAEGQEYVDALVESAEVEDNPFTGDQLRCVSAALVDAVGIEGLQDAASPDEIRENPEGRLSDFGISFDEEQANQIFDQSTDCGVDFREVLRASMSDSGLSDEDIACVDEAISEDALRQFMVAAFTEDADALSEAESQFEEAAESCGADF